MTSGDAINLGLIVTEAVINALKYAFAPNAANCEIAISYVQTGSSWRLSIADNGRGMQAVSKPGKRDGLGTTIVNALALRLKAKVAIESSALGTTLYIIGQPSH
jgi:chemotaxis protein methyltransferase CheR